MGNELTDFYVYVICRPNGTPCYIGKGRGRRWIRHATSSHNPHLANIYKNHGNLPIYKAAASLTEKQAFQIEISLIAFFGRSPNGTLVNMTDGGDGTSGPKTDEHRLAIGIALRNSPSAAKRAKNISISLKGIQKTKNHLHAQSESQKLVWARLSIEEREHRKRIASETSAFAGKNLSQEHREAISNGILTSPLNAGRGEKISNALKGRKRTEEHCLNISLAKNGIKHGSYSQSHREAIRAGQLAAWERRKQGKKGTT
jgi:hypothetical protein